MKLIYIFENLIIKKKIFLILIVISVFKFSNAQLFNAGGKIGLAFDHALSSNLKNNAFKTGVAFGIFGEYLLSPLLSTQLELNYAQKGFVNNFSETNNSQNENFRIKTKFILNYINIPLILRFNFGEDNETKYFFEFGPYVDIRWSAKIKGVVSKDYLTTTYDSLGLPIDPFTESHALDVEPIKTELTKYDYGVTLGIGFMIPIDRYPGNFFTEIRYDLGLSKSNINAEYFSRYKNYDLKYSNLNNEGLSFVKGSIYINVGFTYIIY